MSKIYTLGKIAMVAAMLLATNSGFASSERVLVTNNNSGKSVFIPENTVQVAQNVFTLGTSVDSDTGKVVQGYMIVHPKKNFKKPDGTPGGKKGGGSAGSSCYAFLAKDAKWKTVEPWIVNPTNPDGMSDASVFTILDNGIKKWEDAASYNILGIGSSTSTALVADTSSTDGLNEVYFSLLDEGTIGVTIVWGIFGGPPQNRQLVEWDQVYNTFYDWSDTGAAGAMDFDNIATHELGHSVGLADLYSSECSEETMYGFGTEGETSKRDLNTGDIAGIQKLY